MLALDANCSLMVTTMTSISSSAAVAVSRELSTRTCHPCIRPRKYNIPGTSKVTIIPNKRSPSFSSLAISSDEAVSVAAATASDPGLTWQILVGTLAGVIPFIVAAIEFSKRIVEQKKCELCQGSGLVLIDNKDFKDYIRCPDCGGFLPWVSWKRFFSG